MNRVLILGNKLIIPMVVSIMSGNVVKDNGRYCSSQRTQEIIQVAVFRIRDILRRIRILGSVHSLTDPVPVPDLAFFVTGFQDAIKNKFIFLIFFLITVLTLLWYIYISLQR